jgi:hypothetical protein
VRTSLFQFDLKSPDEPSMPPPEGEVVSLQEHINVPVDQHPDVQFFFVLFYLDIFSSVVQLCWSHLGSAWHDCQKTGTGDRMSHYGSRTWLDAR